MTDLLCPLCGHASSENDLGDDDLLCPCCKNPLETGAGSEAQDVGGEGSRSPLEASARSEPQAYKVAFTGSAREYFRIWIVNTFLTVVTIGIYGAWAKVRTRQYFYAHTMLAGQSFEYLADPKKILRGHLIVGSFFLLYIALRTYSPLYEPVLVGVFYLFLPLLIYKSLRFYAANSAFRNVRFRFLGTLGQSYATYLFIPLLIPFTLGLIVPYWSFRRKSYFFKNFAFGTAVNVFRGTPKPFYKAYGVAVLVFLATTIPIVGLTVAVISSLTRTVCAASTGSVTVFSIATVVAVYLLMLTTITLSQQYLYARLVNYCWANTTLGTVCFRSTLKARRLWWIRLSNILAIVSSVGLLIPWAKVRRTRYILENLTLTADGGLDQFATAADQEVSAVGETATDFFDIDIGL